jgi:hypothetical protein
MLRAQLNQWYSSVTKTRSGLGIAELFFPGALYDTSCHAKYVQPLSKNLSP